MPISNLQQITLDDALNDPDPLSFDAPKRPPQTARITCRVCNRKEDVPISSSGLLCALCRADLGATERHIKETLAAAEQALHDAWARWDADLAHSDESEWWSKVSAAALAVSRGEMTQADYDRKVKSALNLERATALVERGEISQADYDQKARRAALLRQSMAVEALVKAMERTQGWADAALAEVETARNG